MQPDQTLDVDRMPAEAGSTVEFHDVLLVDDGGGLQVGTPLVEGARVVAEVIEYGRDKKVLVFKYKNKTRYRRRHGHRQGYMRVAIKQILTHGREPTELQEEKPARASRQRKAPRKKAEPAEIEAVMPSPTPEATEAPVTEGAAPAKRTSRARKPAQSATDAETEPSAGAQAKPARRRAVKKSDSGE